MLQWLFPLDNLLVLWARLAFLTWKLTLAFLAALSMASKLDGFMSFVLRVLGFAVPFLS